MFIIALLASMILIAIDQISKYIAVQYLKPVGSVSIIEGIFSLTFVENRGAAFGIFQGGRWFFVVLTVIFLIGIIVYYYKLPQTNLYTWVRFSLILIFAGAVGNFIDRFRNGYVVDFLHARFIDFPVFNIADIYVVSGTFLLSFLLLFFIKNDDTALAKAAEDVPEMPEASENA